jgi:hypothetical protein
MGFGVSEAVIINPGVKDLDGAFGCLCCRLNVAILRPDDELPGKAMA